MNWKMSTHIKPISLQYEFQINWISKSMFLFSMDWHIWNVQNDFLSFSIWPMDDSHCKGPGFANDLIKVPCP